MSLPTASSIISACGPYFEHVFGSELDGTRVHKYDLLAWALERTGTDPRAR